MTPSRLIDTLSKPLLTASLVLLFLVPATARGEKCIQAKSKSKGSRVGFLFTNKCPVLLHCRTKVKWFCNDKPQPLSQFVCQVKTRRSKLCATRLDCKGRRRWLTEWACSSKPFTGQKKTAEKPKSRICAKETFQKEKARLGYRFSSSCDRKSYCLFKVSWRCKGKARRVLTKKCDVSPNGSSECWVDTPCSGRRRWLSVFACQADSYPSLPNPPRP